MTHLARPTFTRTAGLALSLLTAALAGCTQVTPPAVGAVVVNNLNAPQGVIVAADGTLYVGDAGTAGSTVLGTLPPNPPGFPQPVQIKLGNTARVIRVDPKGIQTVVATTPSVSIGMEPTGVGKLTLLGSDLYFTNGFWNNGAQVPGTIARPARVAGLLKLSGGAVTEVTNSWDIEVSKNAYPGPLDTHPYGVSAGPDGNIWMADAGGNDLLKYDVATKALSVVSVFAPIPNVNPPAGVPPVSDPVPTAVAFLGATPYVSLLSGFPFSSGASKVLRIAPDGSFSDYATGLNSLTDLVTGPDGNLYAVSLGTWALGAQGPALTAKSGSVIRIKPGGVKETLLGGLESPTSLAFNGKGDAFVAVGGSAGPGIGQVLRYDLLTNYPARP